MARTRRERERERRRRESERQTDRRRGLERKEKKWSINYQPVSRATGITTLESLSGSIARSTIPGYEQSRPMIYIVARDRNPAPPWPCSICVYVTKCTYISRRGAGILSPPRDPATLCFLDVPNSKNFIEPCGNRSPALRRSRLRNRPPRAIDK